MDTRYGRQQAEGDKGMADQSPNEEKGAYSDEAAASSSGEGSLSSRNPIKQWKEAELGSFLKFQESTTTMVTPVISVTDGVMKEKSRFLCAAIEVEDEKNGKEEETG